MFGPITDSFLDFNSTLKVLLKHGKTMDNKNINRFMWVKHCHKPSPSHHHFYRWCNFTIQPLFFYPHDSFRVPVVLERPICPAATPSSIHRGQRAELSAGQRVNGPWLQGCVFLVPGYGLVPPIFVWTDLYVFQRCCARYTSGYVK